MVSGWVSARSSADFVVRSLQWNTSSPVLIFPYSLPSPAFPITCLRTRPTSFCRVCWPEHRTLGSVPNLPLCDLEQVLWLSRTPAALVGVWRGWASLFLRFFLAIKYENHNSLPPTLSPIDGLLASLDLSVRIFLSSKADNPSHP